MAKSGARLIGIGIVAAAIGAVMATQESLNKGPIVQYTIPTILILCLGGAALFLYGLYKLIAGAIKRE